jgi:NitT/TauT family transport system substrate-binding protein
MSIGVWLSLPDKDGLTVVVDQDTYYRAAPVVNKVNVATEAILEARGAEVEAVLRALVLISRDFAADPNAWAAAMAPYATGMAPADLEALAQSFAGSWSVNGGLNAAELGYTQDWLYATEDFAGVPPVGLSDWVDYGPLDRVLAGLGVDASGDVPGR